MKTFFKQYLFELLLFLVFLVFSGWLMWHTFGYANGQILIAAKAWSDFGSHIPLIRSFSLGSNLTDLQYPIFPGEPIRYHFLFYLFVGFLERLGLRLDFALNLPSAFSFAFLLFSVYLLAREIFKSRAVALLSVLLFLLNGSFSFVEFFKNHPLSWMTPGQIATNTAFPSFGPYDQKIVSAFWNLNIYTNQRHLALPFALLLFLVFVLFRQERKKKNFSPFLIFGGGIFIGVLPFAHSSIFLMAVIVLGMMFILLKNQRLNILAISMVGSLMSLPRVIFLKQTASFIPRVELGYLAPHPLTIANFLNYWLFNLGLCLFLIPVGFVLAPKQGRKLFVSFLPLFILGNVVQLSAEMAGNHKFFNVFLAVGDIFVSAAIIKIWQRGMAGKVAAFVLLFFVTFSGVIDFFAVKNDFFYKIDDYPKSVEVSWIKENTPKSAVFLNSSYLYNPASLAGRKIFLGWPYFAWSLGYDTNGRDRLMREMLNASDLEGFCRAVHSNKIGYIELSNPDSNSELAINFDFFKNNFEEIFKNPKTNLFIFNTEGCFKGPNRK